MSQFLHVAALASIPRIVNFWSDVHPLITDFPSGVTPRLIQVNEACEKLSAVLEREKKIGRMQGFLNCLLHNRYIDGDTGTGLKVQNSWYTSKGYRVQKLGHWDVWQASENSWYASKGQGVQK